MSIPIEQSIPIIISYLYVYFKKIYTINASLRVIMIFNKI